MAAHTPLSATQALFRVFVAPNAPSMAVRQCSRPHLLLGARYATYNKPAAAPVVRQERWNEEIRSRTVQLVDPVTSKLQPPAFTRDILAQLDLKVERLVQVSPIMTNKQSNDIPVCKVVNIREAQRAEMERAKKAKEQRRIRTLETTVKTMELNWAIDAHDLRHRLSRVSEWLAAGRRVEVVLAPKKRSRRATPEECTQLVDQVMATVDGVQGAKLLKAMEGKIGKVALFQVQGKAAVPQAGPPTT